MQQATHTAGASRGTNRSGALVDLAHEAHPGLLLLDITIGTGPSGGRCSTRWRPTRACRLFRWSWPRWPNALLAGHDHALQRPELQVWSEH
jgi:hypothetical protein